MTPENKIKREIIVRYILENPEDSCGPLDTNEQVDAEYSRLNEDWGLQDTAEEFREGEVQTNLECDWSRHYESKAVARKLSDGTWVGWTYWYGGGKHGEPEAIGWMDDAYEINCVETEKLVVVREFTKVETKCHP